MNPARLLSAAARRADKALLSPLKMRRLAGAADPQLASVGRALVNLCARRLEPEEARWIQNIERIRAQTETSTKVVEVPDFGAGSAQDARTATEMKQGRLCIEIIGGACRNYSKEALWAELLFHLIRQFKPVSCVEMGACLGISGAYQAAALSLNGAGKLHTMEGAPAFAQVAIDNWKTLGLSERVSVSIGPFHNTLASVLAEGRPVDCCFIDGHHDEMATLHYFEQVLPCLAPSALLVFDDIRWSPGMKRAWDKIRMDSRTGFHVDLGKVGFCLIGCGALGGVCLRVE